MPQREGPPAANQGGQETTGADVEASLSPAADETADVTRCRRCGRPLATDLAVAARMGPTCAMAVIGRTPRVRQAIDAAQLALELEGVVA